MGKSITLSSIVFTLSFCLNLVAGKNLPYKGSPSAGAKPILVEVEDLEDNNGEDYGVAFPKDATDEEKKAAIDSYRKAYKEINSGNDYGVAFPKDATDEEKKAAIDSYRKAYKEINNGNDYGVAFPKV